MDDIACHTRNRDHMTMILLDHGWQEFSNHPEMRYSIDLESLSDMLFLRTQNGPAWRNAGVVDEDGRITMIFPDFLGDSGNIRSRRNIALVEGNIGSLVRRLSTNFSSKREVNILTNSRLWRVQV